VQCPICGSETGVVFESEFGVIPNRYYSGTTRHNFNFSLNACNNCLTVINFSDNVSDSQVFSGYTYRSPVTNMDDESVLYLTRKINLYFNNKIDGLCEVGGNNGFFLSKLGLKVNNRESFVHIDKVRPDFFPTARHIEEFLDMELVSRLSLEKKFDVVVARHCMAHNKKILPFWESLFSLVSTSGIVYIELADLSSSLDNDDYGQFYPEHRYSLSLYSVNYIANLFGFEIIDAVNLNIHNGSIGVIMSRVGNFPIEYNFSKYYKAKTLSKISNLSVNFYSWLSNIKQNLDEYSSIGLWGASAKAVFTLNLLGVPYLKKINKVIDNTPEKYGKYPPGFKVPCQGENEIRSSDVFLAGAPNYIEILMKKSSLLNAEIVDTYDFTFKR